MLIIFSALSCKDDSRTKEKAINVGIGTENDIACEPHISKNKKNNLNISILLDLSDRIDAPQQQIEDSSYILSLAKSFNSHIKGKKLGLLYDKMEVFFEPAPLDVEINTLAEQLKITYVKGVSKNEWMPKTLERYSAVPTQIYELARVRSKGEEYPGSDTWGFFQNHIDDYCIETCSRNILVILTDGYLYHEANLRDKKNGETSYLTPKLLAQLKLNRPDWKEEMKRKNLGFIPATSGLDDLEVLVLGIQSNNDNNPYAKDIIQTYWQNWLKEMGVKKFKIKNADLPSYMEKVIRDFVLKE